VKYPIMLSMRSAILLIACVGSTTMAIQTRGSAKTLAEAVADLQRKAYNNPQFGAQILAEINRQNTPSKKSSFIEKSIPVREFIFWSLPNLERDGLVLYLKGIQRSLRIPHFGV
jgi:hypothetical protein